MGEAFAGQDVKYIGIHSANASPVPSLFQHPRRIEGVEKGCKGTSLALVSTGRAGVRAIFHFLGVFVPWW